MTIRRVACVGAGQIGQGWATLFSSSGFEVVLQDVSEAVLEKALSNVRSNLLFLETNNLLRQGDAQAALKKIETRTHIGEAVGRADYIQESAPDDYVVKKKVFKEMDGSAPDHAILASSSSGLLMTEIQKAVTRPERCVLVHPVLPVHLIPLVEIVGGEQTSRETVIAAYDFMKRLRKAPVLLKREVPGYIINRFQAALVREAIDLVGDLLDDLLKRRRVFREGRAHLVARALLDLRHEPEHLLPLARVGHVVDDRRPQHRVEVLRAVGKRRIRTDRDALHALRAILGNVKRRLAAGDIL